MASPAYQISQTHCQVFLSATLHKTAVVTIPHTCAVFLDSSLFNATFSVTQTTQDRIKRRHVNDDGL
jgi:hypothetical protein